MVFDNLEKIGSLSMEAKREALNSQNRFKLQKGLHRSNMMLNPLNLKHLNSIDSLQADAITLNLEDAIAPSRKEEALINIAYFLSHLKSTKSEIIIRVNPLNSGGLEEIEFLKEFCFNAIRVSKIKAKSEIEKVLSILPEDKKVHISLETKEAFRDLKFWQIDSRFERANLGILDLLADLGLPQSILTINNNTVAYILSKFLIDCKIAGVEPVSFMYQDYKNIDYFTKLCKWEQSLGFSSKACMGPAQVEVANKIFAPTDDDINRALEIKQAFESNSKRGVTGFMHDKYGFIDEPIYRDALNLLDNF